ncbi:MAG: flagellar export protein FliJ [Deltaproteobacteria bacterium]|nr:flagellar export protein FliJ [Deltaproteobacteria bacterium]
MITRGRFRFSLETVLRVRILREEQARLELVQALALLERHRLSLKETERLLAEEMHAWRSAMPRAVTIQDYRIRAGYLEHLKGAIQDWQLRINRQKAEVEAKQRRVQHLYRERRLLANLRDKQYLRFKRELARGLEKEAEAAVLSRWPGNAIF